MSADSSPAEEWFASRAGRRAAHCRAWLLFSLLAATLAPLNVAAHLAGPETRAVESPNGEYLLVILTPKAFRKDRRGVSDYDPKTDRPISEEDLRDWEEREAKVKSLEQKYPRSGLYRNDGSTKLLWPIPYVSRCMDLFVADDGVHCVALESDGAGDDRTDPSPEEFLRFFSAGKKIASVDYWDAVPLFRSRTLLANCGLGVRHPLTERWSFRNDSANPAAVTVVSDGGQSLTFELATGRRTSAWSPWTFYLSAPILAVPLALVASRKFWRSGTASDHGRRRWQISLSDAMLVVALVACLLTAIKRGEPATAGLLAVAFLGAVVAKVRSGRRRALFLGALLAIYGAYAALHLLCLLDAAFFTDFRLFMFLIGEAGERVLLLAALLPGCSLLGGWIAGRSCDLRPAATMTAFDTNAAPPSQ